jgi:hypothetical protein
MGVRSHRRHANLMTFMSLVVRRRKEGSMFRTFAMAFVIVGVCAVPGTVSAASADRDGVRKVERIDRHSARAYSRRSAERAPRRAADDEAWVGNRTDAAGNSYIYFRTGVGTPFGPGRVLR